MQKQTNIVDQVAFIICFRESTTDRKMALQFVLNWLNKYLPQIEILIIEQDEKPKLNLTLYPNCQKVFLYNPGLFNRSWAFNVALNYTNKEILAFSDADAVLTKADYLACFEACLQYDAVTPNARMALNIDQVNVDTLKFTTKDQRYISFASMLMMITRTGLASIGGWDERFEGWGYEDIALGHLILNRLKTKSFNHTIYHVDHERTKFDGETQPQYQFNKKLFQETCLLAGNALNRYCELRQAQEKGNPRKYKLPIDKSKKVQITTPPKPTFVLGLLILNQQNLVKKFIDNWLEYRTKKVNWRLIIVDDGSDKIHLDYLGNLKIKRTEIILLKNNNRGVGHSLNVLLKQLTFFPYEIAFVCQPLISFKQTGWENLYYKIVKRTGLDLLVYQNEALLNSIKTKKIGFLSSSEFVDQLRPQFFTITPKIIEEIGYMDNQYLGFSHIVFQEYFLRCCRAGFNLIHQPLDADQSNAFIEIQEIDILKEEKEDQRFLRQLTPFLREWHANLFQLNRIYLEWNEVALTFKEYQKIMEEQFPKLKKNENISIICT